MEEPVRPCLRCDTLVEESRAYCPRCGNHLSTVRLVVPRPAAAAPLDEAAMANWFHGVLVVCGALGLLAVGAALAGSL